MFKIDAQNCAKLHYNTPDFEIIQAGGFVFCAVTKQKILLEDLKYWNVERQEAYVDAKAMMTKEKEFRN